MHYTVAAAASVMIRRMKDICPAKDENHNIFVRVLHDACVELGGEHHLAGYLGIPVRLVEQWLNNESIPPDWVFLKCSDLLHSKTG